jgi:thiopurine S-methyltransferase
MSNNPDFWRARWKEKRIGFHQAHPSLLLTELYALFKPEPKSRVLVPLCGKSLDLVWLADQGHEVVGVEAVEQAVEEFRAENPGREDIELLAEDFFQLRAKKLGRFRWIFDRGALVAMDYGQQEKYAQHEASFLEPEGRIFLLTVEYDDTVMSGPPFSVPDSKVRELYAGARLIERLAERDCLEQRFIERGLKVMTEAAYAIAY